jgi:para-aminobenzoate synthetase/4-amino-4-deoxychorismate lyase
VHLAPLLNHYQPKFSLREVLLVYRQLPLNLAAHLQRIENSAQKLWFKFCKEIVRQQILNFCSDLSYDNEYMLTLSLDYLGEVAISAEILPPPRWPLKIMLLNKQLDLSHPLFEHKTNASLSSELFRYLDARYRPGGVDKLIFINQDGLMIGSNNANLILGIKHKWYTPAVSAGVLRGSYRESLLAFGEIAEANLTPSDLKTAHKIMLINDLYGLTVCQFMGIVE